MSSSAGQASQGLAATGYSLNRQSEGGNSPQAIYQGNNTSATFGGEAFNDSGLGDDEFVSPEGLDYKDFPIFDDFPEDYANTDGFFADADATVEATTESRFGEGNKSGAEYGYTPCCQVFKAEDDAFFSNIVQEVSVTAVSDTVYEAVKDYDIRSQPAYIPPPFSQDVDVAVEPLRVWTGTHFRHEHIAYQLSQPSYAAHE